MRRINGKGFTLIEIMIAMAIVIAIGAIVSFSLMDRVSVSKIKADIQSTRVLRSALDLYEAELQTAALSRTDAAADFELLIEANYISNSLIKPQSGGVWVYENKKLYLQLTYNSSVEKAVAGLSEEEKGFIKYAGG